MATDEEGSDPQIPSVWAGGYQADWVLEREAFLEEAGQEVARAFDRETASAHHASDRQASDYQEVANSKNKTKIKCF